MAEVVTGEAVVLELAVARFPTRIIALLLDVLVQIPILILVEIVVSVTAAPHLNGASAAAVLIAGIELTVIGYPVIFETLSRGKTLGKMAMGIRVVSDDGGPVRFRQALIRALSLAFIEFWSPLAVFGLPAGLITSMISKKGKRLGDMFAGTFVIQERVPNRPYLAPAFTVVPPPLAGWAQHLEVSRLSDQTAAAASSYLRRYYQLTPAARDHLGVQIADAVAAQISPPPPPGTPPAAFLAAVLTVRRDREYARMSARLDQQVPVAGPQGTLPFTSATQGPVAPPGLPMQDAAATVAAPAVATPPVAGPAAAGPAVAGPAVAGPAEHAEAPQAAEAPVDVTEADQTADFGETARAAAEPAEDFGFKAPF